MLRVLVALKFKVWSDRFHKMKRRSPKGYSKNNSPVKVRRAKIGSESDFESNVNGLENGSKSEFDLNIKLALTEMARYSDEPEAIVKRESIADFKPISLEKAKSGNYSRPVRVYADGVFDVFHAGHARMLRQAKVLFPHTYLIVGVSPDHEVHSYKGQTVNTEWERFEAVRHCRYVDEVYKGCPWVITMDFLEDLKIDFVAHDDLPYTSGSSGGSGDIYKFVKEAGRFAATQRTEGISTSDLISRVVKDYDHYVRRNLSRGYSRKDMNVGFLKEKEIRFKARIERSRSWVSSVETRSQQLIRRWEDNAKDFVSSFLDGFHSVQAAKNIWNKSRGVFIKGTLKSPEASGSEDEMEVSEDENGGSMISVRSLSSSKSRETAASGRKILKARSRSTPTPRTSEIKYC